MQWTYAIAGAVLGGLFTAIVGPLAVSWFKNPHSVPEGHAGILFDRGAAVRERGELISPGSWFPIPRDPKYDEGAHLPVRLIRPGKAVVMLPGRYKLLIAAQKGRTTSDVTIPVWTSDGEVLLSRLIATFDLTDAGVIIELCKSPIGGFNIRVSSLFQHVANRVAAINMAASLEDRTDNDKLAEKIMTEALAFDELAKLGVVTTCVAVTEISPGPATQAAAATREIAQGLRAIAEALREITTGVRAAISGRNE